MSGRGWGGGILRTTEGVYVFMPSLEEQRKTRPDGAGSIVLAGRQKEAS